MKTTLILAALASGALATPAFAQAPSGNYLQINLGTNVAADADVSVTVPPDTVSGAFDIKQGVFASIAGGARAGGGFTVEAEVLYFSADFDTEGSGLDASVATYAGMINTIYTFESGSLRPYIGAGLGAGSSEYKIDIHSVDDPGLAWQVKAGVTIPMSERMAWDIGYRFLHTPLFEKGDGLVKGEVETEAHFLTVGARFVF